MGDKKGFVAKTAFELPRGRDVTQGGEGQGSHFGRTKGNMS